APMVAVAGTAMVLSGSAAATRARKAAVLSALVVCAIAVAYGAIWASYGFRYSASRDSAEGKLPLVKEAPPSWGGRAVLALAEHHVLPEAYLYSVAFTLNRKTRGGAFLLGNFYGAGGTPYFFPATFLFKTPLPALALILAGVVLALRAKAMARWFVLAP